MLRTEPAAVYFSSSRTSVLDIPITFGQKPGLYIESDRVSAVYSDRKISALEVSKNFVFISTNVNFPRMLLLFLFFRLLCLIYAMKLILLEILLSPMIR